MNMKPMNAKMSKARPPSAPPIMRPRGTLSFQESTGDEDGVNVEDGTSVDDEDEDVVTFGVTEM